MNAKVCDRCEEVFGEPEGAFLSMMSLSGLHSPTGQLRDDKDRLAKELCGACVEDVKALLASVPTEDDGCQPYPRRHRCRDEEDGEEAE